MLRFLIFRALGALLTVTVSALIVFVAIRLIPGDPVGALLERRYDPAIAESLRKLYGLDKPLPAQFVTWLGGLVSGDFGQSIASGAPVRDQLGETVPRTLYLLAGGVVLGVAIAVPAAVIAARNRRRWPDMLMIAGATTLMAIPQFWLGLLLILVFAVQLGWLPAAGYVDPAEDLAGSLRSMILPWLTIALTMAAFVARIFRSSILDVLAQDYVRTARARGLTESQIMLHHVFRNASIPTVTAIGLEIGYLLGGAIVVEVVFAYPGVGRLIVDAIIARDYPVVQAAALFFAVGFILVNLLTDVLYAVLDPRVRLRSG